MMSGWALVGIATALAMDAFSVSLASGATLREVSGRHTFRLAWHFGFFQALMPVVGWSAGMTFYAFIERVDHWLAFALLCFVGARMIIGAFKTDDRAVGRPDPTRGVTLVMLSVATSVDALAIGISYPS